MKTNEKLIDTSSEYYVYSPSKTAKNCFYYPLQCGHFLYHPGYHIERDSFDSFLILYVQKGELSLTLNGDEYLCKTGQFMFLDCYHAHAYQTFQPCECLWCHFDGKMARNLYDEIISRLGPVFYCSDSLQAYKCLEQIYDTFRSFKQIKEPLLNKYLNDLLMHFFMSSTAKTASLSHKELAEQTISYINEHFTEEITNVSLSQLVGMSQYHFLRIFKEETGYSLHQYLCNTRMSAAKFLLKTTNLSVKEICFHTGFSCESVFCNAFKKQTKMTPAEYRIYSTGAST